MSNVLDLIQIPADVNWTPTNTGVPLHLLDSTDYRPDEPERERWRTLSRYLPEERQARIGKCGLFAVHTSTQTTAGTAEAVRPVSCMDKAACAYCGNRYAGDMAGDRLAKLLCVCRGARAALVVIEASSDCSTWNACVRAEGCATSEARGRLCGPGQGCRPCALARIEHAKAADIEAHLQKRLTKAWTRLSPGSGGTYNTRIEPGPNGLRLVVGLLVPAVACTVAVGGATAGYFTPPKLADLQAAWDAAGGVGEVILRYAESDLEIQREIFSAHLPALERLMLSRVLITQALIRTLVRAVGLTAITLTGKPRRVQRTAWFGVFSGRYQVHALRAFNVSRVDNEKQAEVRVTDHYKILGRNADYIEVQSTRTMVRRMLSMALWRSGYVDANGLPLSGVAQTTWIHSRGYGEKLLSYAQMLTGARKLSNRSISEPKNLREYQRAINKEFGAVMDSRSPVRQVPWTGSESSRANLRTAAAKVVQP